MITADKKQRLYVGIPAGKGYTSCLGFEVCEDRIKRLGAELNRLGFALPAPHRRGTVERYYQLEKMQTDARLYHERSGYRFECDLTPQLKGLEGRRVEVVDKEGTKRRFWVGKSTGWIPIHLEIARRNCLGGGGVWGAPFLAVRVIMEAGRR